MGKATLADLLTAPTPQRGPKCGVALVLRVMPDDDRETLEQALVTDPIDLPHANLWRALKALGYEVREDTLRRHRLGKCRCSS